MAAGSLANATTVAFDFAAMPSGAWSSSLALASGGVSLTVTGATTAGGAAKVKASAGQGLGVKSTADCTFKNVCHGLEGLIDSMGPDDLVNLAFSLPVRVLSLTFGMADAKDRFDFYAGSVKQFHAPAMSLVIVNSAFDTHFGVGASLFDRTVCRMTKAKRPKQICKTYQWDSAFLLTGITVEAASSAVQAAVVPLPTGGSLALAGPVALLLAGRRKNRRHRA